jgi:hypothetical protein
MQPEYQMQPLTGANTETTSQAPLTVPRTGSVNLERGEKAGQSPGLAECGDHTAPQSYIHGERLHTRLGRPIGDGLRAYTPIAWEQKWDTKKEDKQEESGRVGKQKAAIRHNASVRLHAASSNHTQLRRGVWAPAQRGPRTSSGPIYRVSELSAQGGSISGKVTEWNP